jgi:hypothetical protein
MTNRKFYRTVIQVEILSESPYTEDYNLEAIAYDIGQGDCSGRVTDIVLNEEVDGPTMSKLLLAQGSDPGFFMLDDEELEDVED